MSKTRNEISIILLDEQISTIKNSESGKVIEIVLCDDQIKDVFANTKLREAIDILKAKNKKEDLVATFGNVIGRSSILANISSKALQSEVSNRIAMGSIDIDDLIEESEGNDFDHFKKDNLESVELWESFLEASKRCKPRDLITLLDNAK